MIDLSTFGQMTNGLEMLTRAQNKLADSHGYGLAVTIGGTVLPENIVEECRPIVERHINAEIERIKEGLRAIGLDVDAVSPSAATDVPVQG